MSRSYEEIIEQSLESEEAFRTYLSGSGNVRRVFNSFQTLRDLCHKAYDDRERLAAEVETLREEVNEHRDGKMRMEGALTYVEEQLFTLRAVPAPVQTPAHAPAPAVPAAAAPEPPRPLSTPPLVPARPSGSEEPPTEHGKVKVIKIPNPPTFHHNDQDQITYDDWYLQMRNKMRVNGVYMPTEELKMAFVQSLVADNALAQLKPRLRDDTTRPFTTAKEMFEVLTAACGNPNRKQEARTEYRALRQGTKDFNTFWAEFLRLAQELDHSDETLIDDLIDKCHYSIQQRLATGDKDPTDLFLLAKRCQRIEQSLKKVERNKGFYEQNAKRNAARKNNGPNKDIFNAP